MISHYTSMQFSEKLTGSSAITDLGDGGGVKWLGLRWLLVEGLISLEQCPTHSNLYKCLPFATATDMDSEHLLRVCSYFLDPDWRREQFPSNTSDFKSGRTSAN